MEMPRVDVLVEELSDMKSCIPIYELLVKDLNQHWKKRSALFKCKNSDSIYTVRGWVREMPTDTGSIREFDSVQINLKGV